MLNINQFRELIVKSSLNDLLLYSKDAEELMIFTCAVESDGGTYIRQIKGPALGIYQMEPQTHNDIWMNYIYGHGALSMRLFANFDISNRPDESRMIYDMRYSTAMARIHYLRVKDSLPPCHNVEAIWEYYKKYYNTVKGAAQKDESIKKYHDFVLSQN
jgi:hypothetical protein